MKAVRLRSFSVPIILLLGIGLSFSAFGLLRKHNHDRLHKELSLLGESYAVTLQRSIQENLAGLLALGGFYAGSREVERGEFKAFSQYILSNRPGIDALLWLPRIRDEDRKSFEVSARRDLPDFEVTEEDASGGLVPASYQEEYFPVFYAEPFSSNRKVLGFDHASDRVRRRAMEKAEASGSFSTSAWTWLVTGSPDETDRLGFLAYLPIYRKDTALDSERDRNKHLIGFAAAVFRLREILKSSLNIYQLRQIEIFLSAWPDDSEGRFPHVLNFHLPDQEIRMVERNSVTDLKNFWWQKTFEVQGTTWWVGCRPTPEFFEVRTSRESWAVLAIGLLLILSITGVLHHLQTRAETVERLVAKRTAELAQSQNERDQLELFAFVASHDLKEPLSKIIAFGNLLEIRAARAIDEKGKDYLRRIQNAAGRMNQLIEDLVNFCKVSTRIAPLESVPLQEVVRTVLDDLELRIEESGASIDVGPLPIVLADPSQMHLLFQNLIANALKFRKTEAPLRIKISAGQSPPGLASVTVRDNGIGFDEVALNHIFKPFERLHSQSEYPGSGLGLAICQKIVAQHGGGITAESKPGEGASFIVMLKAPPGERNPLRPMRREKSVREKKEVFHESKENSRH